MICSKIQKYYENCHKIIKEELPNLLSGMGADDLGQKDSSMAFWHPKWGAWVDFITSDSKKCKDDTYCVDTHINIFYQSGIVETSYVSELEKDIDKIFETYQRKSDKKI